MQKIQRTTYHIFFKNKIHLPPEFKLNSGVQRKVFCLQIVWVYVNFYPLKSVFLKRLVAGLKLIHKLKVTIGINYLIIFLLIVTWHTPGRQSLKSAIAC